MVRRVHGARGAPRPRGSPVAAAALLAVLLAVSPSPARAADDEVRTAHVLARGDVGAERLRAYAALGEACYPQWKAYFGAEPKASLLPLVMDVRKDRDEFLAALRAVGIGGPMTGAGGYYAPRGHTSYLYLQPHDSSTRLLVLHELTHQFQYEAVLEGAPERSPPWHREGLAEHFGCHRRTAAGLETGALDVVAIDERPVECARRVAAGTFDPWAVGTGTKGADYTDALALVETLLRTKDAGLRDAFRRWEDDARRGGDGGAKFERDFAGRRARLEAAAREVWGGFRRTWHVVYVAWDEAEGTIVGRGMPWALLRGTEERGLEGSSIEATMTLAEGAVAGGLALCVRGPDDLVAVELRGGGVHLCRKRAGVWCDLAAVPRPLGSSRRSVGLRLAVRDAALFASADGGDPVRVGASDVGLAPSDLRGTAGLFAESGEAAFSQVRLGN